MKYGVVGNGIAGAAVARRLALSVPAKFSEITLYEIGRGPGGRAATRKSRSIPQMSINHGAPFADISTPQGLELLRSLSYAIKPYAGRQAILDLNGQMQRSSQQEAGSELITGHDGEMASISGSMLCDQKGDRLPAIETAYSTMVRGLAKPDGPDSQWHLRDKSGEVIGVADWLIVSGNGIAHPRWSEIFGGEPPLVEAASVLGDQTLESALSVIAQQMAVPVLAVLMHATGGLAQRWRALELEYLLLQGDPILAKIAIQPTENGECSIVLHSTTDFALRNRGVYGSSSSAARVGDASSDASREGEIVEQMLAALNRLPDMPEADATDYDYGPLLHRWGNAFPQGPALPLQKAVCPHSKVAFCGDYVETPARMGSFECALIAGSMVADTVIDIVEHKNSG